MKFFLCFFAALCLTTAACNNDLTACEADDQEAQIQDYIDKEGLVTQRTASGIHYIIEEEGSQIRPAPDSRVRVRYKGYLIDGSVFDEPPGVTEFALNELIAGWGEGLQLFKKGGKGTLIIPCQLAYGERNQVRIPSASVIIFDIELVDVL